MKIILYQPEIPQNTGNIIRTCNVTNTELILIPPFGFSLSNRHFKRAGLDYHKNVKIKIIDNLENFLDTTKEPFYFFSSKASKNYSEINYSNNSILIFGSETSGLPDKFINKWKENFVKIPMKEEARCLNLSISVSIGLYESLRQNSFAF